MVGVCLPSVYLDLLAWCGILDAKFLSGLVAFSLPGISKCADVEGGVLRSCTSDHAGVFSPVKKCFQV